VGLHGGRLVANLTPGPDTFYILGRSTAQGSKVGLLSALGIGLGSLGHTLLAAFGLSALLATSAMAFLAVKLLGAGYLLYLGVRMLQARFKRGQRCGPAGSGAAGQDPA
jgi:threonine/homoserine/homoserine lactone efflux protein